MESKTLQDNQTVGLNRRQFVTGAAATAAFAGTTATAAFTIIKPSQIRGAEANSKVEIGVVGQGGRGRWITNFFAQHGGYKVVALADYFPQVVDKAGEELGVDKARRFSGLLGYKRMIESKVDAVVLETPPYVFPEHATAAVNAGCHVYMAKPVACDVPGCLTIAELAKKNTQQKKVFLVDFQIRTCPFWQESLSRIRKGDLGKIPIICSYYFDEGFSDPVRTKTIESRLRHLVWVNDEDLGASYLVNAGIHALDGALWIAGDKPPLSAMGCSRRSRKDPHGDSHDVYSITYEMPDGSLIAHRGEHIKNDSGNDFCGLVAYGQGATMEGRYTGKTWIHGGPGGGWRGGENTGLYAEGAKRNVALFHKNITEGVYDNATAPTSVNSTLTTILGREAGKINGKMTWDEMIKANKKIEVDLSGLTQ
ncbi:MAG: Gfo/Idh/MocA family oxidoreductase [Candidatus Sumerlaeota bacterium]|nr:Gfo/Idh/MocA family oxidoreductase [Candidatus Sumerlaeota bacterium]